MIGFPDETKWDLKDIIAWIDALIPGGWNKAASRDEFVSMFYVLVLDDHLSVRNALTLLKRALYAVKGEYGD